MTEEIMIKPIYSDEVLGILNDVWIKEFLKRDHKIREEAGLKKLTDLDLIIYLLKQYENRRKRMALKKAKRNKEVDNGKEKK